VTRALRLTVLGLAVVVAAGCGGASSDERWAGDVCAAIANWNRETTKTVFLPLQRLRPTSTPHVRRGVLQGIAQSERLRRKLELDLKRRDPPNENARAAAKALTFRLGATRDVLSVTREQFERHARSLPQKPGQQDLADLLHEYVKLTLEADSKMSNVIDEVLFEAPRMTDEFLDADGCKKIRILSREPAP
jgi:hypothetical protein